MDVANVEKDDLSEEFVPHQIFLNHVDAFNSRYIAAVRRFSPCYSLYLR